MEGKTETRFLTVVDTYAGYCQVCHEPRVVARVAVAGWKHHGTLCSQCLNALADEVHRRGKGQADEKAGKMRSDEEMLVAIVKGNGNGHARAPLRH
jgi:hypothetical protein